MQTDFDNDLESYFTDMEHLRGIFKDFVSAEKLPKRLIVLHGVGGVGKSSLLRMFRLHCKNEKISVALASGDDAKSTVDVITRWMEDLKEDGVKFSSLNKTLESYRAIQAKVEDQAKKSQNRVADIAGKAASKTAEAAGGALLGAAIGSVVPGMGTAIGGMIGSAIGGMGAEAFTDWLRGFLDKSSIDLLLDPAKKLTSDFLEDIVKTAEKKRIVLLLDTYEQMSALEDWIGEAVQKIHPNVLMVIAGRKLPDWSRVWSSWMINAQVEELKPMTEDIMRQLIRRYYSTMRGGEPDPTQVETIIRFARGLPMVVTSAVQLWVKYGVEDFQSVKAEIVANLVDRLMEGVPSNLIPALEAAAVVRWFDQPILRAVLNKEDVRDIYNELRRFPFVRTRVEGLALHDSVREIMDENLRVQDSERHAELHERAALYFEKRIKKVTSEEAERLGLERLYHRIRADEEIGIKIFQETAEGLSRYEFLSRLQILLNDFLTYTLQESNSQYWRDYYLARLEALIGRRDSAIKIYRRLVEKVKEPKLRAYILCDLGGLLVDREHFQKTGEEGKQLLDQAFSLMPKIDPKVVSGYSHLRWYYLEKGLWNEGIETLQTQIQFLNEEGDQYGFIQAIKDKAFLYGYLGDWRNSLNLHNQVSQNLSLLDSNHSLKANFHARPWYLIWSGNLKQAEIGLLQAIDGFDEVGRSEQVLAARRDLGFVLALQDDFENANKNFQDVLPFFNSQDNAGDSGSFYGFLGYSKAREGNIEYALELLIKSWEIKQQIGDVMGYQEILNWLGLISEIKLPYKSIHVTTNDTYYLQSLSYKHFGRHHFECGALTGITRIKHAQGAIAAIPSLLTEAEQLAQQYEYNDHLASLRLTQSHLAWESRNQDEAFAFYQKAMIYALRYNRFLLDELLSGRPQGTPLRPIIPYCLEHGEEGKEILVALRDWWKTSINDIGTPRPDTISPIPEGISLMDAEKIARERETGDGSMQKSVIEQIEMAL